VTDALTRAASLVAPYRDRQGVLGAFLGGSSSRPYADEHADLDLFIVFTDEAYAGLAEQERYRVTLTPRRQKDVETLCLSRSQLVEESQSRRDGLRAPSAHVQLLFATDAWLPEMLARIGGLAEDERLPRLRVAYHELVWTSSKAKKARLRGTLANARLLELAALEAARRVLLVARGRRPGRADWAEQELRLAGVPGELLDAWIAAAIADPPPLDALRKALDAWLSSEGHTLHLNTFMLANWFTFTDEGRRAAERFAQVL